MSTSRRSVRVWSVGSPVRRHDLVVPTWLAAGELAGRVVSACGLDGAKGPWRWWAAGGWVDAARPLPADVSEVWLVPARPGGLPEPARREPTRPSRVLAWGWACAWCAPWPVGVVAPWVACALSACRPRGPALAIWWLAAGGMRLGLQRDVSLLAALCLGHALRVASAESS